jgi:ABC-2 type transport system permease protein
MSFLTPMRETLFRILNLMRKELAHFSRDRVLTPMILLGPVAELILIGIATSGDIERLPTAVLNLDQGEKGAVLVQMIDANPVFNVDSSISEQTRARSLLDEGRLTAIFVIPQDFSQRLAEPLSASGTEVELVVDGSDIIAAEAARFGAEELVDQFAALVSLGWLEESGSAFTSFEGPTVRVLFNEELKKSFYELPAEMGIMLFFVAAGVASLGIARERERGTWEQLLVTPMRPVEIVVGKALPAIPIAYAVFLMMMAVSLIGFGLPMRGSWALLLSVVLLYILVELSVGTLISAFSRTQIQAFLLVTTLMMLEFIFSGYIFAVDTMPKAVQAIANFVPMKHGLNMIRSILLRGVGLDALWPNILMLAALGAGILAVATLVVRRRLD